MRYAIVRYVIAGLIALSPLRPQTPPPAAPVPPPEPERHLRLFNTHTAEHIEVIYKRGARFLPEAIARLNHFLRDHRSGEDGSFDPRVFDIVADVLASVGKPDAEVHIISGYRSPASNRFLRETTTGVAKNSLHMKSQAIDIRIPGLRPSVYREAALKLKRGGVGYYPDSQFVHVDSGRVRRW